MDDESETAMKTIGGGFFIQSHGKVCIVPKYSSKTETSYKHRVELSK